MKAVSWVRTIAKNGEDQVVSDIILLRLPVTYGSDAFERLEEPPHDTTERVRQTKQYIWLRLSRAAAADMLNDALYYSGQGGPDEEYSRRTIAPSARRAIPIIEEALYPGCVCVKEVGCPSLHCPRYAACVGGEG